MTPNQLFVRGVIEQGASITEPASVHLLNTLQASDEVGVPHVLCGAYQELKEQLNPLLSYFQKTYKHSSTVHNNYI